MTGDVEFYHIYSATMNPGFPSRNYRENGCRSWQCRGCGQPLPGCGPIDVELESLQLQRPLNFVWSGFPGLVWQEFLAPLDPKIVARDLIFGRVFNEKGREAKGWATFHGRIRVNVRGATNQTSRVCDECGRLLQSSQGPRFLDKVPPPGVTIYESSLSGLILRPREFQLLDTPRWKKGIYIENLHVEEPPPE